MEAKRTYFLVALDTYPTNTKDMFTQNRLEQSENDSQIKEITRHATEWEINDALYTFFAHDKNFLFVYQDPELLLYTRFLERTEKYANRPFLHKKKLRTYEGKNMLINPKQIRPDGILVDKAGKAYVIETKTQAINSVLECEKLIIQTLYYVDLMISPRWLNSTQEPVLETVTTCDLLKLLYEAHWYLKVHGEGVYSGLLEKHRKHFGLEKKLDAKDFCQTPSVIFLLEKWSTSVLRECCNKIRKMDFDAFYRKASSIFPNSSSNAIPSKYGQIQDNWEEVKRVKFETLNLNRENFQRVVGSKITSVCTESQSHGAVPK